MSKIPNTIYLQWHGDGTPDDLGPVDRDAVTWSTSPVFEHDVRYTRGGWISVDERLPEHGTEVLVWHKHERRMRVSKAEWVKLWRGQGDTHWQPLPDPPAPA
jgi:hypothetical protein